MNSKQFIARRVAREFRDGQVVNLGIGIPALAAEYIPHGVRVILHGENGMIGIGPAPAPGMGHKDITNAGSELATVQPGGCFIDSMTSFAIARGGHLDVTVLGGMQVDEAANLANWRVPGGRLAGMGGAMDFAVGAKRVIVAMEHVTRDGSPKILHTCTLPLTAVSKVSMVVTERAVFAWQPRLTLLELAPGLSVDDIRAVTEADFAVAETLECMA